MDKQGTLTKQDPRHLDDSKIESIIDSPAHAAEEEVEMAKVTEKKNDLQEVELNPIADEKKVEPAKSVDAENHILPTDVNNLSFDEIEPDEMRDIPEIKTKIQLQWHNIHIKA